MTDEQQPSGFLNRAVVVLLLVFSIPAGLTALGTYYVAVQGRVPGGAERQCERVITSDSTLRVDIYAYVAGLVEFETQTVSIRVGNNDWQELFSDTIPVPQPLDCDNVLTELNDQHHLLHNQKSVAWSSDGGVTWQVQRVCDDPRPSSGRCDAETLQYAQVEASPDGQGSLLVVQSDVDDFGEPQRADDGQSIIVNQWRLLTDDAGQSWTLDTLE
ncbi:MAG: hypothetical protein ACFE0Q_06525 [Anaerolineae bacterium]